MEGFFSGLVILIYMVSHYAAESIFVFACLFPIGFLLSVAILLHFGAQGRLIASYRKAKKTLRNGVVAGADRAVFRDVCLKGAPTSVRLAYSAFAEGEISRFDFAEKAKAPIKDRRVFCFGVYYGLSVASSVLVFLSFYFISPLGEAFLRFAIVIFFLSINGAILFFVTFGYAGSSERAAVKLAELLDGKILRKRPDADEYPPLRYTGGASVEEDMIDERFEGESAEKGVERLRRLLREIDVPNV